MFCPKSRTFRCWPGYVYKHNGQSEQAEQDFSEAIKRDPNVETAYVNRGYMLNDLHEPDSAEADFETALKMEPGDGQAHLGLAYSSLDLHKNSQALHEASLAEKSMGDIRDVHVIRATAYGDEGLQGKSATEYRAALKFTPNDGTLRLGLGNALLSLRRYHAAINELDMAAQYSPDDPDSLCIAGPLLRQPPGPAAQTIHFAELAEKHAQSSPGPGAKPRLCRHRPGLGRAGRPERRDGPLPAGARGERQRSRGRTAGHCPAHGAAESSRRRGAADGAGPDGSRGRRNGSAEWHAVHRRGRCLPLAARLRAFAELSAARQNCRRAGPAGSHRHGQQLPGPGRDFKSAGRTCRSCRYRGR